MASVNNSAGGAYSPDLSGYLRQEQSARQDFAAKSAANTFSKTLSQQRGSRQQGDFTRGFNRSLNKFTSGFGQRGLSGGGISSGVMGRAMRNYVGDYTRDLGRMQDDLASEQTQFDFNQARFTAERDNYLAQILADKQAAIANTASQIRALQPYMGGF